MRRWLRFSLRTLFVVVTLVGCWLGYQMNWVRHRHGFIAACQIDAQRVTPTAWVCEYGPDRAPALLWVLGERAVAKINLKFPVPNTRKLAKTDPDVAARVAKATSLFPEAEIHWTRGEPNTGQ